MYYNVMTKLLFFVFSCIYISTICSVGQIESIILSHPLYLVKLIGHDKTQSQTLLNEPLKVDPLLVKLKLKAVKKVSCIDKDQTFSVRR